MSTQLNLAGRETSQSLVSSVSTRASYEILVCRRALPSGSRLRIPHKGGRVSKLASPDRNEARAKDKRKMGVRDKENKTNWRKEIKSPWPLLLYMRSRFVLTSKSVLFARLSLDSTK